MRRLIAVAALLPILSYADDVTKLKNMNASQYELLDLKLAVITQFMTQEMLKKDRWDRILKPSDNSFEVIQAGVNYKTSDNGFTIFFNHTAKSKHLKPEVCESIKSHLNGIPQIKNLPAELLPASFTPESEVITLKVNITAEENAALKIDC